MGLPLVNRYAAKLVDRKQKKPAEGSRQYGRYLDDSLRSFGRTQYARCDGRVSMRTCIIQFHDGEEKSIKDFLFLN